MFSSHVSDIALALSESESVTTDYAIELLGELSSEELEQVALCLESEGLDGHAKHARKLYRRHCSVPIGWAHAG